MASLGKGATLISLERPHGEGKQRSHLSVRFLSATEFVQQYADNLTHGAVFVRNAESLKPLEEVTLALHLPGFKWFRLHGRVTHVVDILTSERLQTPMGAGIELLDPPAPFMKALQAYLARLGHRSDCLVLVCECDCLGLLSSAGYWSQCCTQEELLHVLEKHKHDMRAIVIPPHAFATYEKLLEGTGYEVLLAIYNRAAANTILSDLDARLPV